MRKALAALLLTTVSSANAQSVGDMIRKLPFDILRPGVAERWKETRTDVLLNIEECEEDRTLMLSMNGEFLGHVQRIPETEDAELSEYARKSFNQRQIDDWRRQQPRRVINAYDNIGYPFAYSCTDENRDFILQGISNYHDSEITPWGPYEFTGMIAPKEAFDVVAQRHPDVPTQAGNLLRGQYVVESGGDAHARSDKHALGAMQIIPYNLEHICGLEENEFTHKLAQIDCAFTITQENAERLEDSFENVFSHLPEEKKNALFSYFLAHSYHAGVNNFVDMMKSGIEGRAVRWYAQNHDPYSADDIMFGIVFHNYDAKNDGRNFGSIKSATMNYLTNARIALDLLGE